MSTRQSVTTITEATDPAVWGQIATAWVGLRAVISAERPHTPRRVVAALTAGEVPALAFADGTCAPVADCEVAYLDTAKLLRRLSANR